ncbi:uncharacterized protein ACR2FA_006149 [Aphomia sociella]
MVAVQNKLLSQRAAAKQYGIPRRTLKNHLDSGKVERKLGRNPILTINHEKDLVSRIIRLASIGVPLTPNVIRRQVYVFCEENNITHNFSKKSKRAGKDWLRLFLKRHPDISKRKAQILNPARAQKLNKPIVMQHFKNIKKVYDDLDIINHPERLFNMDKKGCRLTIHNQPTVLAQKGAKRVRMVSSEHAENVTVAACVNAVGTSISPMVIFKGKRLKTEFTDNLPAGSLVKMAEKGSMTTSLFIDFIKHLGKYKPPGKCLLIFDGASCHQDYLIVEAAEIENIVLYCLPANTTHELQPLDKSVNKSFEHYWDQETLLFLYQNPDKKITKARFKTIFSKVWYKCMKIDNIVNGFKATGFYPYNPEVIPIEAYAPSVLTEISNITQQPSVTENDLAKQTSPIPDTSGINMRYLARRPSIRSSDSYKTNIENSPSILQREHLSPSLTFSTKISKSLVDYSSTDSDCTKLNIPVESPRAVADYIMSQSIIYSSASDTSITDTLTLRQRFQVNQHIYSSSEDENVDPILTQERTPDKVINQGYSKYYVTKKKSETSSDADDSEDNIPIERLKEKYEI